MSSIKEKLDDMYREEIERTKSEHTETKKKPKSDYYDNPYDVNCPINWIQLRSLLYFVLYAIIVAGFVYFVTSMYTLGFENK